MASIDGINLNRFQNPRTLDYLRGNIPEFKLFSVSQNTLQSNRLETNNSQLNAYSQFTIPKTRFTSEYQVNQPSTRDPNTVGYFTYNSANDFLRNAQPVSSKTAAQLNNFNTPIAVQLGNVGSKLDQTVFPAQAPNSPSRFQDQIENYAISDLNLAALTAQPDFALPRNGQGFRVFTNPDGSINRIKTDLSVQANQSTPGSSSDAFALFNRADITRGATFTSTPIAARDGLPAIGANTGALSGPVGNLSSDVLSANRPPNPFANSTNLPVNFSLFGADRLSGLNGGLNDLSNDPRSIALSQRLQQLLPPNQGLTVSGPGSEVQNLDTVQSIAAQKSGYGLHIGNNTEKTVAQIQQEQLIQGEVYTNTRKAMAEMSARMPMVANLPQSAQSSSGFLGTLGQLGAEISTYIEDAASKKGGSGGGFSLSSGLSRGDGGSSGGLFEGGGMTSGSNSGFSGGSGGEQGFAQRRRMSYNA